MRRCRAAKCSALERARPMDELLNSAKFLATLHAMAVTEPASNTGATLKYVVLTSLSKCSVLSQCGASTSSFYEDIAPLGPADPFFFVARSDVIYKSALSPVTHTELCGNH